MNKYEQHAHEVRLLRQIANACARKKHFVSRAAALAHNKGQQAYHCQYCNGWHLSGALNRTLTFLKRHGNHQRP